jgi:hypothetical protein
MGRAKVLATDEKKTIMTTTAVSIKFAIPVPVDNEIGNFIKMDRNEDNIVLHFTKKSFNSSVQSKEGMIVSFD